MASVQLERELPLEVESTNSVEIENDPVRHPTGGSIRVLSDGYSATLMPRERTPEHAVQNFEGEFDIVHARNVTARRCNKNCLNFWFIGGVMMAITVVCIVMLAVNGLEAPGTAYWQTLLTFAIGVMVPNPKYKSSVKIRAR